MDDLTYRKYLVCSDSQCGHIGGLTPPAWRVSKARCEQALGGDWNHVEKVCWNFFKKNTRGRYDGLILLGDLIDGKERKQGSREVITADRNEQVKMAIECFKGIDANEKALVYGTGYHVGRDERFEEQIAKELKAEIRNIQEILIKDFDVLMRFRHFISRTSTPTGGDIALRKQILNELTWERDHAIRPADVYGFAHAHYFRVMQDAKWTAYTNPSLQAWTEFGATKCSGVIHFGVVELIIYEDKRVFVIPKLMELKTVKLNEPLEW